MNDAKTYAHQGHSAQPGLALGEVVRFSNQKQARKWAETVMALNPGKAMTPTARLVLLALATRWHGKHDLHGIRGSVRYLQKVLGCGKNSIERALKELQQGGAIENIETNPDKSARWILNPRGGEVVECPQNADTPADGGCPQNGDTPNPKMGTPPTQQCPQNGGEMYRSAPARGFETPNGTAETGCKVADDSAPYPPGYPWPGDWMPE